MPLVPRGVGIDCPVWALSTIVVLRAVDLRVWVMRGVGGCHGLGPTFRSRVYGSRVRQGRPVAPKAEPRGASARGLFWPLDDVAVALLMAWIVAPQT
jgi:hypothetical protein